MSVESAVAPEQGHSAEEKLALHLQQRDEDGGGLSDAHIILAVHVHEFPEKASVDFLPHKGLGDANAVDRFGQA